MKIITITVSFALLVGFASADEKPGHVCAKDNPERKDQVEAYKGIFAAAKDVVIYEGLPHPNDEEDLLKTELKRKDIVKLPPLDEAFYTPAVKAIDAEAMLKLLSGSDGIRVNTPSKCGFHSDYCIQFEDQDTIYRAFVCFGCVEVLVVQGDSRVTFGFDDEKLKELLAPYHNKRPKKVNAE